MVRLLLLVVMSVVLVLGQAQAQDPKHAPKLTPEQRQVQLKERDQLRQQAAQLDKAGKTAEALTVLEKVLGIEQAILEPSHQELLHSLGKLAGLHEARNDFAAAHKARQTILDRYRQRYGQEHWQVGDAQRELADLELRTRWTPEQRHDLAKARLLSLQGFQDFKQGHSTKALKTLQQALAIRKQLLGEHHADYAQNLNDLAGCYTLQRTHDRAEPLYQQALEIRKQSLGEKHPLYASSLHYLASLYYIQGAYERAEPLGRQALEIRKQSLGEKHPDRTASLILLAKLKMAQGAYNRAEPLYRQVLEIRKESLGEKDLSYADSLDNLAALYRLQGAYDRAEPLYRQALEIRKQTQGEKHPQYATSLASLAAFYAVQGAYDRAEPLYRQALEIRKQTQGEKHPQYATTLINLANLYQGQAAYGRAELLYRQALEIYQQALGEKHPDYAHCLHCLVVLYAAQGAYGRAEPLCRQALEIRKQTLGDKHLDYARSLRDLAGLSKAQGDYDRAEPLSQQALEICKQTLGEKHPDYANSLSSLASIYYAQGASDRAEPLLRQILQILTVHLEQAALAQTELDQLAHARLIESNVSSYLTVSQHAKTPTGQVYARMLPWKGAVTTRQQLTCFARTALKQSDTETALLFQRLEAISGQLARLTGATPDPSKQAESSKRLEQLSQEREQLEKDLARKTGAFRKLRQSQQLTPAQLQQVLPTDTALVDYLIYRRYSRDGKSSTSHLVAFVVRRDRIERIELKELADVEAAVDRFVTGISRRVAPVQGKDDPALLLRERLWLPLAEHLDGVKTVLISPSGPLCRLPWAALPNTKGDKFLLEELAIAVIPVPQLLPQLLEPHKEPHTQPSLLVLGDVNFDAGEAVAAKPALELPAWERQRAGGALAWQQLPGTRAEMLAIAASFRKAVPKGQLTSLRDNEATEAALRRLAGQHEHLHLATHGFFAPEKYRSALQVDHLKQPLVELEKKPQIMGYHPGLLSGLVLAGANQPREDADDEVLTALEVGHMDLSKVKLAVLSACETGLGKVAGGEGVLGLQRAFQVAGARSTVTSYWKVDDDATRRLMERFYENYWLKRQGSLAALREAQLWMLREGRSDLAVQRGVERVNAPALPQDGRLPPYYWAAFVLSGDWR